jgi:hypothetical protein
MLEDLVAVKDLVALIQEQERGDTIDLRGEEDFLATFCNNVNRTGAGFNASVDTEKMNVVTDLRFRQR